LKSWFDQRLEDAIKAAEESNSKSGAEESLDTADSQDTESISSNTGN
jgi:hypothetical protein